MTNVMLESPCSKPVSPVEALTCKHFLRVSVCIASPSAGLLVCYCAPLDRLAAASPRWVMERLDYGAGTKYYPNPSLGLGLQRHPKQQHGKQQFSLVALNPHAHTLGLQAQVLL